MLLNEFDSEFAPLASLQQGEPIEFMVKGADNLYQKTKGISDSFTRQDNQCRQLGPWSGHCGFSEPDAKFTVQPNEREIQREAGEQAKLPVAILSVLRNVNHLQRKT